MIGPRGGRTSGALLPGDGFRLGRPYQQVSITPLPPLPLTYLPTR